MQVSGLIPRGNTKIFSWWFHSIMISSLKLSNKMPPPLKGQKKVNYEHSFEALSTVLTDIRNCLKWSIGIILFNFHSIVIENSTVTVWTIEHFHILVLNNTNVALSVNNSIVSSQNRILLYISSYHWSLTQIVNFKNIIKLNPNRLIRHDTVTEIWT